jgi:hypothetical protein
MQKKKKNWQHAACAATDQSAVLLPSSLVFVGFVIVLVRIIPFPIFMLKRKQYVDQVMCIRLVVKQKV